MRRSTWVLSGSAAVLVAASVVTRLVVYPSVHQIPEDTDTTFEYTGTATLLNAAAVESGDLANAFLTDIPITLDRHVKVVETDGSTAVVTDDVVVTGADGTELSATSHRWAVDRENLGDVPAPEGSEAEEHQGLVISWPLDPKEQDYTLWDATTATEAPAVYDRTEEVEGRTAYVYVIEAAGALADPAMLERFPVALPRDVLAGIAQGLPAEQQPDPALLAQLPEEVPLTYAASATRVAWVDSETGAVLNGTLEQSVVAQIQGPEGPVNLAPVSVLDVAGTEEGTKERADDADSNAQMLWLVRMAIPLGLAAVAAVLVALAVWRELRGRGRDGDGESGGEPAPAAAG
ncbi:porin PorA family protein [Streptomyces sp. DSM 44915]|uniref:Porin PorA family protein n=1 Tax=Streptomyces chisholmiae TaxID=3075540 RepID=A0ABU2JU31_9ACTN|nr:porin PorA family protein [Streptomyces sp. DSM 44915]MDT0268497.1 porin PorA family protein [Streptomyces sp. DSM 44915]